MVGVHVAVQRIERRLDSSPRPRSVLLRRRISHLSLNQVAEVVPIFRSLESDLNHQRRQPRSPGFAAARLRGDSEDLSVRRLWYRIAVEDSRLRIMDRSDQALQQSTRLHRAAGSSPSMDEFRPKGPWRRSWASDAARCGGRSMCSSKRGGSTATRDAEPLSIPGPPPAYRDARARCRGLRRARARA